MNVTSASYPLSERLCDLELRVRELRATADLWNVLSGFERLDRLEETRKEGIIQFFGQDGDESALLANNEVAAKRLNGIRSQLQAAALQLNEQISSIDSDVNRAQSQIKVGDLNGAFRCLAGAENVVLVAKLVRDRCNGLIAQRLGEQTRNALALLDLMTLEVYGVITENLRGEGSQEITTLPPVSYCNSLPGDQRPMVQPAAVEELLPFPTIRVESSLMSWEWNAVRAYVDLSRRLYAELYLDPEIRIIFGQALSAQRVSFSAHSIMLQARQEIISQMLAVIIGGPAVVAASMENDFRPGELIMQEGNWGQLPPYISWMAQCSALKALGFATEAVEKLSLIMSLYGPPQYVARPSARFTPLLECLPVFDILAETLLRTPFSMLQGIRIDEVLPVYDQKVHQQAARVAEDVINRAGLSRVVEEQENSRPSIKTAQTTASPQEAHNGRPQRKRRGQAASSSETAATETPEIAPVVCALRFAFERASVVPGKGSELLKSARTLINETSEAFYRSVAAKRFAKEVTVDDVRRMRRRVQSPFVPRFIHEGAAD